MSKVVGQQQSATAVTNAPHPAVKGHHVPGPSHHGVVWGEEARGRVSGARCAGCIGGALSPQGSPGYPGPAPWLVSSGAAHLGSRVCLQEPQLQDNLSSRDAPR